MIHHLSPNTHRISWAANSLAARENVTSFWENGSRTESFQTDSRTARAKIRPSERENAPPVPLNLTLGVACTRAAAFARSCQPRFPRTHTPRTLRARQPHALAREPPAKFR